MLFTSRRSLLAAGAALFGLTLVRRAPVWAGGGLCHHCRCHDPCRKVCRLVCEEKKVEVVCWGGKCEDFCLPPPSKQKCRHCELVCGTCESCAKQGVTAKPKKFVWFEWIPGCSTRLATKNKLMKKVVTKKVPTYKWVLEDLCGKCESACLGAEIPADVELPPPPIADVPLKFVRLETLSDSDIGR